MTTEILNKEEINNDAASGETINTETENRPQNPAFSLGSIISSKCFPPQKVVVYGVPGVGKTTFAATWPEPVLLRAEDGAAALDIPTFPQLVSSMADLSTALNALITGEHDFKTLVLDSLDWMEPFVWRQVCRENGKPDIEAFGYGKGYILVDRLWQKVQTGLDILRRKKGMHILAIAHAQPQRFDPPDMDPYMRYDIKLHKRASALWTEWADMLLFLNYRTTVKDTKTNKEGKVVGAGKGMGSGERMIYTRENAAWLAKSRWPLPPDIYIGQDATWQGFHEELNKATKGEYRNA